MQLVGASDGIDAVALAKDADHFAVEREFGAALPVALETQNVVDLFKEGVDVFTHLGREETAGPH